MSSFESLPSLAYNIVDGQDCRGELYESSQGMKSVQRGRAPGHRFQNYIRGSIVIIISAAEVESSRRCIISKS